MNELAVVVCVLPVVGRCMQSADHESESWCGWPRPDHTLHSTDSSSRLVHRLTMEMETRIPTGAADDGEGMGLSTSASTIRTLPLPPLPLPQRSSPYALPHDTSTSTSTSTPSSPSSSSSLISLDYDSNLDSVSSSFFFSSAAASPPHPHPHPAQQGGELVIPSLVLPAPLLVPGNGQDPLRRRKRRENHPQLARFLVVGEPKGLFPTDGNADSMRGWCISEEEDDEGGYKVLRLTPEAKDKDREAVELVFVAEDVRQLGTHVPSITSLILQPFRSLASVLRSPSAMPIRPEDEDEAEDDLISALLASDASPLYTALLVMSVSGPDDDNEGKIPDALRRLVPVLVLDHGQLPLNQGDEHSALAAHSPPTSSSSPSPPPPHPLANPGEDAPHVDPNPNPIATIPASPASPSLFAFEGDGDPGDDALVSPPAPAPSAATTASTSSASDPDADHDAPAQPDEDPDPDPPLATARPIITIHIHDNTHALLPKPDQSTSPLPGLTPHKIRELRRDAAGLFVDWWDAEAEASVNARGARHAKAYDSFSYLPRSRTNPPSSIASASASATRSTSRKQHHRHRHHGHHHSPWPFTPYTPYSVNVTDPLHLPSLLRLVRDVVWGSVSMSVSGVWGTFVAGLVCWVGVGEGVGREGKGREGKGREGKAGYGLGRAGELGEGCGKAWLGAAAAALLFCQLGFVKAQECRRVDNVMLGLGCGKFCLLWNGAHGPIILTPVSMVYVLVGGYSLPSVWVWVGPFQIGT
ncbi:hypothetical protein C8F01DRAFT_1233289 [Mycena amicta]|nr:hypothetical protein C8F01DRAFT_1233289 [Mycena amicta]